MNAPADPQQQESQIFLGRQPILNRNQDLVAYELLFRSGQQNFASFTDGVQATATVIVNAFAEMSLGEVLGHCRGFINVDENFLLSDVLELLPPQSVVLEILETVVPTPEVLAPLGLTQEVMQALCTSEGQLAQLLKIVIADEQNEPEKIMLALAQLPRLDLSTVSRCLAQALAWANSIEEEAQR